MYRADFVVGRIAQVGKIEFGHGPFAPAGRVLDALATVGNTGVMKSLDLLGAGARERWRSRKVRHQTRGLSQARRRRSGWRDVGGGTSLCSRHPPARCVKIRHRLGFLKTM